MIKYRKRKNKSIATKDKIDEDDAVDVTIEVIEELTLNEKSSESFSEEEKKEILIFFKSCHVESNKIALMEKLQNTVQLRCEIFEEKNKDLREIFPFYFVSPEIVSSIIIKMILIRLYCYFDLPFYRFWKTSKSDGSA